MNLGASVVVIRARTLGEVMDLAFRLLVTFFGDYARLAFALLFPAALVCVGLRFGLDAPWWAVWAIALVFAFFLEGPFTVLTSRLLFGERLGVRGVLAFYRSRFGAHLGSSLLTLLFYSIGSTVGVLLIASSSTTLSSGAGVSTLCFGVLLLAVPCFFIAARVIFVDQATLLENATLGVARDRSRRLAAASASGSFAIVLAILFARVSSIVAFELLGDGLVHELLQLGRPFGYLFHDGGSLYALLGLFAATPVIAVIRFLLYIDIRTRGDGWDIQIRFMDLVAKDAVRAR